VQLKISLFVRPILLLFYKEVCAANLPPMLLGTQCKGRQIKKSSAVNCLSNPIMANDKCDPQSIYELFKMQVQKKALHPFFFECHGN
jgi:hypothetical protein